MYEILKNTIFGMSSCLILNWWYLDHKSIFEKIRATCNWLSKSSILYSVGIGFLGLATSEYFHIFDVLIKIFLLRQ